MTPDDIKKLAGHRTVTPWVINLVQEAFQSAQDWNEIEALRESLREHMAEIHRLRAALAEGAMQPLTEDEIDRAWRSVDYTVSYDRFRIDIARAIERAHGIGSEE